MNCAARSFTVPANADPAMLGAAATPPANASAMRPPPTSCLRPGTFIRNRSLSLDLGHQEETIKRPTVHESRVRLVSERRLLSFSYRPSLHSIVVRVLI